jgi:menaquinone-dependent protoporphyrinogen IX oxidase
MLVTIMKTLIICFSYHHKNTEKIASVFAKTLNAEIKTPSEVNPTTLSEYDLVGFGSGIVYGKHHKLLLDFADKLPQVTNKHSYSPPADKQETDLNSTRTSEKNLSPKGSVSRGSLTVQGSIHLRF